MATSSLSVKSTTTAGKSVQKAVTNINPQASAANLSTFAQMINSLTNHTYVGADLIDKTNVDTETRPGGGGSDKTEPTLTVASDGAITYNGDGQLFINSSGTDAQSVFLHIYENQISAKNAAGSTPQSYTCKIHATEGTNYAAKSVNFSYGS